MQSVNYKELRKGFETSLWIIWEGRVNLMFGVPMETVCCRHSLDSSGYFCPSTTSRMRIGMRSRCGQEGKREGSRGVGWGKSRQTIPWTDYHDNCPLKVWISTYNYLDLYIINRHFNTLSRIDYRLVVDLYSSLITLDLPNPSCFLEEKNKQTKNKI